MCTLAENKCGDIMKLELNIQAVHCRRQILLNFSAKGDRRYFQNDNWEQLFT
jgi:hypothetical protein